MKCTKCKATTTVRHTYPQTTYDAMTGTDIPVVLRYRVCELCGATRKTVEVTADVLLRLTNDSKNKENA